MARDLWDRIAPILERDDRILLSQIFVGRKFGLEEALDALDQDPYSEFPLRHRVAKAIAQVFLECSPDLTYPRKFVRGLSKRSDSKVPVFCLNYDQLIEEAAAEESIICCDGFCGGLKAYFTTETFHHLLAVPTTRMGRSTRDLVSGTLQLVKLHGSVSWFESDGNRFVRLDPRLPEIHDLRRVMIPPQRRKQHDTAVAPYSYLWSEFRGLLTNDRVRLLNRLVCVGYSFKDQHVNAVIRAALARPDFTLLIFAKMLTDDVLAEWSTLRNVVIVTEKHGHLKGDDVGSIPDAWSFEWLAEELNGR